MSCKNPHKTLFLFLLFLLFATNNIYAGGRSKTGTKSVSAQTNAAILPPDTLQATAAQNDLRQKKQQAQLKNLKNSGERYFFSLSYVFAKLTTSLNFNVQGSVVNITTSLENNLGLPPKTTFLSGSFIYRITPTSGVFFSYYGFNRSVVYTTDKDFIWGTDTIPAGTRSKVYFRTQVFSAGYILSLLKKPETFLGIYLNFYIMPIKLGYNSDLTKKSANYNFVAPLPNLGLVGSFKLNKWLTLNGNMGFFSLYTENIGGYLHDLNISMLFRVTPFMNINMNYQVFNIYVIIPDEKINTSVNYEFKGPAVGLTFNF